jgi:MoaA/NifB/PqqE/SkfB family radical SAM enzyme
MENKNFCIKPFNSLQVSTTGDILTCCKIKPKLSDYKGNRNFNIKQNSIVDFWKSDYLKYLQTEFLDQRRPKECKQCWNDEQNNVKSERQFANQHYKIIGNKKPEYYLKHLKKENVDHPEDYNLDITNLCNLKCYMCGGGSSSKLLVENNDLGIEKLNQKDFDMEQEKIDYLIEEIVSHNVTNITLQGGEPLINPKIILLLKKVSQTDMAKNLSVWITTNGTMYTKEIFNTLQKFKTVKLIFSVDGVEKTNNYLRFPSKWDNIESNIKAFKKLQNASFQITFTVQNLNLLDIKNIIDVSNKHNIHLKLNLLNYPIYLKLNVLPKKTLEIALKNLKSINNNDVVHVTNFNRIKEIVIQAIEKKENVQKELEFFKSIMKKRDKYRNISMKNYLPELAEHLNI